MLGSSKVSKANRHNPTNSNRHYNISSHNNSSNYSRPPLKIRRMDRATMPIFDRVSIQENDECDRPNIAS